MFKLVVTNILNSEVVNNEYKHNGVPLVAPNPRRGDGFIVASFIKARAE